MGGGGPLVLVTGARGFVGQATVAALTAAGFEVRGATRGVAEDGWVTVAPLGPDTDWTGALDGVDAVVHLAAHVHVTDRAAAQNEGAFQQTNRDGTLALARAAATAGVTRFVFISSIKVNGEGREAPYTEDDGPLPFDAYARSKLSAELGLKAIAADTDMRITTLRPPLVYGPGVGGNFRSLLRLVHGGVPLPLASVDNRRSMIFVDNLASAIVAALRGDAGGTYLLSDGEDVSTPELIRRLAQRMGKRARLLPLPVRLLRATAEPLGRGPQLDRLTGTLRADSTRFREELGWEPPLSLDGGLRETVRWFLRHEVASERPIP